MNISTAVRKPFSNWGTFAIGSILSLIPIVNFAVTGFGLQNAKEPETLPTFGMDSFILGLKSVGVGIIYGLLTLLAILPFTFKTFGTLIGILATGTDSLFLMTQLTGSFLIVLVIAILAMPLNAMAQLTLARTNNIRESLKVLDIAKKAYTGVFIKTILMVILVSIPLAIIIGLIPVLGVIVMRYVLQVFTWTYIGANTP